MTGRDGFNSLDPYEAELLARAHMRQLGYRDAHTTARGADEGLDVDATKAAAQVKAWAKPVGRPSVQQLVGALQGTGKQAVFYAMSGYTEPTANYGTDANVALFTVSSAEAVQPVNRVARSILRQAEGLGPVISSTVETRWIIMPMVAGILTFLALMLIYANGGLSGVITFWFSLALLAATATGAAFGPKYAQQKADLAYSQHGGTNAKRVDTQDEAPGA